MTRYVTIHSYTGASEIWCSKEDASLAVLTYDLHRVEVKGHAGEWRIIRYRQGETASSSRAKTYISHQVRRIDALYDIAQGFDNHAIMNEAVARHEGYLTD